MNSFSSFSVTEFLLFSYRTLERPNNTPESERLDEPRRSEVVSPNFLVTTKSP